MKKALFITILICILLCGCAKAADSHAPTPAPTPAPTQTPTPTPTPLPTPTPQPTPTPLPDTQRGEKRGCFVSDTTGGSMEYYLNVPENAVEGLPLIVFLHGDGEVAQPDSLAECPFMQAVRTVYGDEPPFIALLPCTWDYTWIDYAIPATLMELIENTAKEYHADGEHIALTGHSRGAVGVWHMVSTYPDFFSAAVPVSCPPRPTRRRILPTRRYGRSWGQL